MTATTYIPKRGVLEATLACNLRCLHCGSGAGAARDDELTTAECTSLFSGLKALGMDWLTISGGEPTMRGDWLDLIANARQAGLRVGMISNAIRLDDRAVAAARAAGLNGLGLSIDGIGASHDRVRGRLGHFDILMKTMEHCRAASLPFSVVTHINRENIHQLEEMSALLSKSGAYAWQLQHASNMGNMRNNQNLLIDRSALPVLERRLAKLIRNRPPAMKIVPSDSIGYFGPFEKTLRSATGAHCFGGCGAGLRNIGIESNGNIKGCLSIMAGYNAQGADYVEGNIREEPLAQIWNRPGAFAYNRNWQKSDLTGFCGSCGFAAKCRGGCLGQRISAGSQTESRMCTYRAMVEAREVPHVSTVAAAAMLAGLMGTAMACDNVDDPAPRDTETTSDTASDSATDSTSDTFPVDLYGIIPDTAPDTATEMDTDTFDVDLYGVFPDDSDPIALYDMVPHSDE